MLQSVGSQRVRHDLVTEQQQNLPMKHLVLDFSLLEGFLFFIYLFLKSLLNSLQYCFCFMFFVSFWPQGM